MKKLNRMVLVWLTIITTVFTGCKDDEKDSIVPEKTSSAWLNFHQVWVNSNTDFVLNKTYVHPRTNDTLEFTTLKYYISNVALQAEDGSWWEMPESYFLVDAENHNAKFEIKKAPVKKYKALRFMHGVDSARNISGNQEGALAPSNGMFWSWMAGYVMLKAEGKSPQSGTGDFSFHLGGFKGDNNVITSRTIEFRDTSLDVKEGSSPNIFIHVNVARLWHSTVGLSVGEAKIDMPSPVAKQMALDVFNWTSLDKIEN